MKEVKNPKGVTEHYTSLESLREAFGLKPLKRRTDDEDKLKAQQEKLVGKCKVCNQPLIWIHGTSICACQNPECKGIKMTGTNSDGTEKIWYIPVTRILDEKGVKIAENLFAE